MLGLGTRPKTRSDISCVVSVLGLDENVGVEQVHQAIPSSLAMVSNVERFFVPSN